MNQINPTERRQQLLAMSHDLGREDRQLAILGEGNTSTRLSADTFLVKASGTSLGTLREEDLVECRFDKLLPLLKEKKLTDTDVDNALLASRVDSASKKPSVEAVFHAWLLTLPDIEFIGHTHAIAVNQILCSPRAREFAAKRLFPDEIVCCGMASVFLPYTDPGLVLAQAIEKHTQAFIRKHERQPRVILIENHGIITLGKSPQAVWSAMWMAEKAARIWIGAATLGGPKFLSQKNVERIAGRPDEHYRQRMLKM